MERHSDTQFGSVRRAFGSLGDWIGCHQIPERSLHLKGVQLPVCARCTGVFLGQMLMILATLAGIRMSLLLAAAFMAPVVADWSIQYAGLKESTNARRVITGLFGGVGYVGALVALALIGIGSMKP